MAAIDKTYVNREKLIEAIKWAKEIGEVTLENGYRFKPLDFICGYNDIDENGVLLNPERESDCYVLWNTPTWFDRWLWINCPLSFVRDRLQEQYSEGRRKEFENWTYIKPESRKNQKFTFLEAPQGYWKWIAKNARRKNPRSNNSRQLTYFIEVKVPGERFEMEYCEQVDMWYPMFGMLPAHDDFVWQDYHLRIPSKKAIIRQLKKWSFPKGTIVRVYNIKYVGLDFKVLVK